MTRGRRKGELVTLVAELNAMHWRAAAIAELLGVTPRHVRHVLCGLRQPPCPWDSLPAKLRERLEDFPKGANKRAE